jgi:hypothetical protein
MTKLWPFESISLEAGYNEGYATGQEEEVGAQSHWLRPQQHRHNEPQRPVTVDPKVSAVLCCTAQSPDTELPGQIVVGWRVEAGSGASSAWTNEDDLG